jgi:hypothetical protein
MLADWIQNDLCSGCGHWHDHTGQMLLGWADFEDHYHPLPRGHMPSDRPFDDLGGRRYGFCVMGRPDPLLDSPNTEETR